MHLQFGTNEGALTDERVDGAVQAVLQQLQKDLGAACAAEAAPSQGEEKPCSRFRWKVWKRRR